MPISSRGRTIYEMTKARRAKHEAASAKPKGGRPPFWRWFFGQFFSITRKHGNIIVLWAGIGYCAHQLSLGLIAYAGKSSFANLSLSVMANVSFVWTASLTLSGLSVSLYLRERALHRRTRERLAARITELEVLIDPNRTSSLLTSDGLTRKEDE